MSVSITVDVCARPDQIAVSVINMGSNLVWCVLLAVGQSTEISVRTCEPVSRRYLIGNELCDVVDGRTNVWTLVPRRISKSPSCGLNLSMTYRDITREIVSIVPKAPRLTKVSCGQPQYAVPERHGAGRSRMVTTEFRITVQWFSATKVV